MQQEGFDTVEANLKFGFKSDLRDYVIWAQILADIGIRQINLLTNNPTKVAGIEGYGLKIVDRVPIEVAPSENNRFYLETKKNKMGHILKFSKNGDK